jgi:hypothetical protein
MEIHVLNGDALREKFPYDEKVIICRECLIEGPVSADNMDQFWTKRATYIEHVFHESPKVYDEVVKNEISKLLDADPTASINLWFEHDLFCQVNMWFIVYFIRSHDLKNPLYRVMPTAASSDIWKGFGGMDKKALRNCFETRLKLSSEDLIHAETLWKAYSTGDLDTLAMVASTASTTLPYLKEVVSAHIERFAGLNGGRPQKRLREILQTGETNFHRIFAEFSKTEGIYGFGDIQVRNLIAQL